MKKLYSNLLSICHEKSFGCFNFFIEISLKLSVDDNEYDLSGLCPDSLNFVSMLSTFGKNKYSSFFERRNQKNSTFLLRLKRSENMNFKDYILVLEAFSERKIKLTTNVNLIFREE
ncbi:hypothetical protein CDAR_217091 [Caerostris darwini]|uniref:LAGLIDADG homing endonuclease n=1 Tax=Caerostris darwini TaxID=1538125 RepID=A0AAV4UUC7_9ARAC|nr:hypothetical protein CDAR_217091 [Caerostris darwini]